MSIFFFGWTVPLMSHSGKFYSLQRVWHSYSFCVWVDAHKQGKFGSGMLTHTGSWSLSLDSVWLDSVLFVLQLVTLTAPPVCPCCHLMITGPVCRCPPIPVCSQWATALPQTQTPGEALLPHHTLPLQLYCNKVCFFFFFNLLHYNIFIYYNISIRRWNQK